MEPNLEQNFSIFDCHYYIYIMSRICGLIPIRVLRKNKNVQIQTTRCDYLLLLMNFIVHAFNSYFIFKINFDLFDKELLIGRFLYTWIFVCASTLMITCNVFYTVLVKKIYAIFFSLHDFDYVINGMGGKVLYNSKKFVAFTIIVLIIIFVVIYSLIIICYTDIITKMIQYFIIFIIVNIFSMFFILNYTFCLYSVLIRYKQLNILLCSLFRLNKHKYKKSYDFPKPLPSPIHVNHLARLHYKLYTVVSQINKLYSFQVATYIIGNFVFTVIILFGIYRYKWILKQNEFLEDFASSQFSWAMYYNLYYFCLFWTGSRIKTEAKDTKNIISKALSKTKDISVREQLLLFLQQIEYTIPLVSCEFFSFDTVVFFKLISGGITYLFILIQFDYLAHSVDKSG